MRLRSRLVLLVIATAIPLAGLAVLASVLLVTHEQENFIRAVKDRNRAFMSAVDAELKGHVNALTTLAALPIFDQQDLRSVRSDLVAVKASQPKWITLILHDPEGRQLLNTLQPAGASLPASLRAQDVRKAADQQVAVIGGIRTGTVSGVLGVPVRVPVVRGGRAVYVLTAVVDPTSFAQLLQDQRLPAGWVSGLVDADQRFVARVPERPLGTFASEGYRTAVAQAREGWYRGTTVDGLDTYTAFERSDLSGWSVGFAIPAEVVTAGARRIGWTLGVLALLCVVAAVSVAVWLGRHIANPIGRLAAAAPTLGQVGTPIDVHSAIPEVRELGRALSDASKAIEDRSRVARLERDLLAQSDRAKDEFIAMLSHEMRNPLAAISAASALLKLATADSEALRSAQRVIERQTRQLGRLVEDLLDVSRIAMGKAVLERQLLDLGLLVDGVLKTWSDAGRLRRHRVQSDIGPGWVNGDPARLEQIVANLLDNAVKFTPDGGTIAVSVATREDRVALTVADTGAGVPKDQLDRMFGLFVQGAQGLSRAHGGLGVGLALVKRLVDLHGGNVRADSAGEGRGTTFVVTLPAVHAIAPVAPAVPQPCAPATSLRILVVEDSDDTRAMLAALLASRGHAVLQAASAEAALGADLAELDVALIDIGLPGMDGYEFARTLRGRAGGAAVWLIAVTGYGQPDDKTRAKTAGFDRHVTKPLTMDVLQPILEACGRRRSESSLSAP